MTHHGNLLLRKHEAQILAKLLSLSPFIRSDQFRTLATAEL